MGDDGPGLPHSLIQKIRDIDFWCILPHIRNLVLDTNQLVARRKINDEVWFGISSNHLADDLTQVQIEQARLASGFEEWKRQTLAAALDDEVDDSNIIDLVNVDVNAPTTNPQSRIVRVLVPGTPSDDEDIEHKETDNDLTQTVDAGGNKQTQLGQNEFTSQQYVPGTYQDESPFNDPDPMNDVTMHRLINTNESFTQQEQDFDIDENIM